LEPRIGVILMNLGGPDQPENVRPFLLELFRDPDVLKLPGGAPVRTSFAWLMATLRAPKVSKLYGEIGGSPLLARTKAQERALERRLNDLAGAAPGEPQRFVVRTAMRYSRPRASEAVSDLLSIGVKTIVALPLYPQYSSATTGSSVKELKALLARRAPNVQLQVVKSYAGDERYVHALSRCVIEALIKLRDAGREAPVVLFSAHGLPKRVIDAGDPYVDEVSGTVAAVMKRLSNFAGKAVIAYQSRAGPVKWLEPSTSETIAKLGAGGVRSLLVVPVSFVSDHFETVYEIDKLFAEQARAAGITAFVRSPALDVRPEFIDALAGLVLDRVPAEPARV
jgi:ferrochelatase